LIAGAAVLAALLRPAGERALVERGVVYTITTVELVLPLVGLGVALVQRGRWELLIMAVLFLGGIPLGRLSEHWLLVEGAVPPEIGRYFVLLGPLCCVVVAVALATPGRARAWVAPVAAVLSGTALGFLVALHDPSVGDPRFVSAAAATGLWLMWLAPAILRRFNKSWLKIGSRIFASWLAAIGLMLGGTKFVIMHRAERPVADSSAPLLSPPSGESEATIGDSPPVLNRPREWDDPSRQP
jgi:hypothetical protein